MSRSKGFPKSLIIATIGLMVCTVIIGISMHTDVGFAKPSQEASCTPCHTPAGEPDAAPLTISINMDNVEVQPSSTFSLEVSASGGEPDHMVVKFPTEVADNSLFTYSLRLIYDSDDGSIDGTVSTTTVIITAPETQGSYTIRVFTATSAYDSYKKTATSADISVIVTAPPPPTHQLTIAVVGSGTTDPAPGVYTYDEDTLVEIDAIPNSGWLLDHWELDSVDVGAADPYTVTMDSDHTLTAVFSRVAASAILTGVGRKPGAILPGNELVLKAHVRNNGSLDVAFYVEFVIKDSSGNEVGRMSTEETIEFAGDGPLWVKTSWQVPIEAGAGTYTVEATLFYKAVGSTEYIAGNTLTSRFKVRA